MDNSLFVYTERQKPIEIERFHICTWEFNNDSSFVEFGFEISKASILGDSLTISLFIPWATSKCRTKDLYENLKMSENSRFIFNDSITRTNSLDGGKNLLGVVHTFGGRNELCILPVSLSLIENKVVTAKVNLQSYNQYDSENQPNIYFRFWIIPPISYISMRKKGISKSTIIYDIKVNERRNIPDDRVSYFSDKVFCNIKTCFLFNILPNKYDIVFFDNSSLKNVRTLEFDAFNKYLSDRRVKKDELIVIFNKKINSESFSFFSIYSKERIGPGQFALAILINIICGVLLFIPSFRKSFQPELPISDLWMNLPNEIFLALGLALVTLVYFIWPTFEGLFENLRSKLQKSL